MRRARHVARRDVMSGNYSFWWGNVKERDYSEHLVLDRRVILKLITYNIDWKVRI